jgi:nicotinic acid mononucleotide adenylyltransferase
MYSKKQQIAILGGSFDPPTIAHIQIACEVYNNIPEIS